jgi:ribosomal protein S18 acetylase RimI-like enzyme
MVVIDQIHTATEESTNRVSEILAEAFSTDPVFNWLSDAPNYNRFAFDFILPTFIPNGHVYISDDRNSAAAWLPPGVEFPASAGIPIMWKTFRAFGFGTLLRFIKILSFVEKHHYKPAHYYLFAIGVTEAAQGKGYGSAQLEKVTALCDEQQVPAYLENSNEKNLELYKRHGFEVTEVLEVPNGPTIWPMLRLPRGKGVT